LSINGFKNSTCQKKNNPYKIKIGANCSNLNELCVYPNKLIELYYSEKFWNFYNQLYSSIKKIEDINITKIMDDLYALKDEPIKAMVHKDSSLITLARDETLAYFNIIKPKKTFFFNSSIPKDNVVDLWSVSLEFLYGEEYINNLIDFFNSKKIRSILDCACGIGFPSIGLKKAGFDVFCSDGSKQMIVKFEEKCKAEKIKIPHQILRWDELDKLLQKFDAVLCRGNSLIYVDSWDSYSNLEKTFDHIKNVLKKMYQKVNSGGILYVDLTSQTEYDNGPELLENFGEKFVNGEKTSLLWRVKHYWRDRKRIVHSERRINGVTYEYDYYSFLLKNEELIKLLKEVGFLKVEPIKISGENGYDIFICTK
jgi:SAM-dependent methyltransferase